MKGLIFSIRRYSIHDGPGIRVTLFMKGCPLNCKWCHNPEGISPLQESVVNILRVGEKEFCRNENAGKYYSMEEILSLLDRDRAFMDHSKGGVTFSGGEPMLQFDFLYSTIKACRERGYQTAIDTSGYSPPEHFESLIPYTDLFLFDIKHLDEIKHFDATGVSNSLILENYRLILEKASAVALRIPVIPGFNDDPDHVGKLVQFIISTKTNALVKINLLPYHRTGSSKYRRFSLPDRMEGTAPPDASEMEKLKKQFQATGIHVKIGG
jgi:pyruvate formate lyase activating enzyme